MPCRCSRACLACTFGSWPIVATAVTPFASTSGIAWGAPPLRRMAYEAPVACPQPIYNNRNRVERLWARLKEWRAVATRCEKTAASFPGVLCLAATADWLRR